MKKEVFRITIGLAVILVHAACFLIIFQFKGDYLTEEQKLSMAFLFMPITAAYVVAIVRSAVDRPEAIDGQRVNLNYALVVTTFTLITLAALLGLVVNLEGAQEVDRQRILLFETVFGAAFGLIASDLFGKVEKYQPQEAQSKVNPPAATPKL